MRRMRGNDGAVAVLVAVLAVVLFGMAAMVVDVSSLWSERRQLQNGADAGALAIAQSCADGTCDATQASTYADDNANDGASNVQEICGSANTGLPTCSAPPIPAPAGTGWVEVRTRTGSDSGPSLMPPILAKVLVPGYTGTTVHANAVANWGAPAGVDGGLAMTFSACEWLAAVGATSLDDTAAAAYAPPPPYSDISAVASFERHIYLHSTSAAGTCNAGPAGSDLPGGFGWLDTVTQSTCEATTEADGTLGVDPGTNVLNACKTALDADYGHIIYIPVYGYTNGLNGTNGTYTVVGYAAFYLTGYYLGSVKRVSLVTGTYPCSGSDRCISGFFTQGLVPGTGTVVGDGAYLGAAVVGLAG